MLKIFPTHQRVWKLSIQNIFNTKLVKLQIAWKYINGEILRTNISKIARIHFNCLFHLCFSCHFMCKNLKLVWIICVSCTTFYLSLIEMATISSVSLYVLNSHIYAIRWMCPAGERNMHAELEQKVLLSSLWTKIYGYIQQQ